MITHLINPEVLRSWAHLSLKERAVMLHRQYPNVKISPSTIRLVYKRAGIKYKQIKRIKSSLPKFSQRYTESFQAMLSGLNDANARGLPIIFLDETMFTYGSYHKKSWAPLEHNIEVEQQLSSKKSLAMIAGVGTEAGVQCFQVYPRSVNTDSFILFIQALSSTLGGRAFALFMDNLSVHKSNKSASKMRKLLITPIYNVPYSPEFNPIELVFAQVKHMFKKRRLELHLKMQPSNERLIIESVMRQIPRELIQSSIEHCREEIVRAELTQYQ